MAAIDETKFEMPKYRRFTNVFALEIERVKYEMTGEPGGWTIYFVDKDFAPVTVANDWFNKHLPEAGGYYVIYGPTYQADYISKENFEANHELVD